MSIDLSTVNHTSFFREPADFTFLSEHVSASLKEAPTSPVRLWSAGCSSGQEPYSMAISLAEALPAHGLAKVDIWASDLSLEMLKVAAGAIYGTRDVQGVSPGRLRRFSCWAADPREGSFRVVPEIRDIVKFPASGSAATASGRYPTTSTSSFAAMCRSTLPRMSVFILLDRLSQHIRPGGWLVMGNGEDPALGAGVAS